MVKTNSCSGINYLLKDVSQEITSEVTSFNGSNTINFNIIITGVNASFNVDIEASLDKENWRLMDRTVVKDAGLHEYVVTDNNKQYYRATICNYTSGTVSIKTLATF